MYIHVHRCRLALPNAVHGAFFVDPTGTLEVELAGKTEPLHANLAELSFWPDEIGDCRLCCGQHWQLRLKPDDAQSLQGLISDAREELASLHRDL
ncbi:hypothetical protein [Ferrimonas balearica]|uniref:hypothetical protein n=1 Tax=Ferrimonas balearica TaxID=44012 RepID=UPI001C93F2EA|nr:hypothetical protein [Ferrimonas balearica]MBY5981198.1 hypothetical protein [Ferrimonas balearica]